MTDINMAVEDLQRELSGRVESYDMFIATRRGLTVEAKGGEVDALNVSQSGGIGLRVIQGGRLGFAFSTVLEGEPLREMVHEAIDGSDNVERDQYLSLPENRGEETPDSLSLYDGRIDTVSEEEKIAMALGLEAQVFVGDLNLRR
ncbi:MAG: PmbA/TldA family metallopeptidase, partial [Thermodesulfobacteriota bacterium]